MIRTDILIIGAGASGLMAGKKLSEAGKKSTILEARNRLGGRIHSLYQDHFPVIAEAGAEFVHGKLELTMKLLNEAGLTTKSTEGKMWQVKDKEWEKENDFIEDWSLVVSRLKELKEDMSIANFLQQEFGELKYKKLRDSLKHYVEGYDAADTTKASTLAFRDEFMSEEDEQYRVKNGYGKLIEYLANKCSANGSTIKLSCTVTEVQWRKNLVKVITSDEQEYTANKIIITVPLGIWQAEPGSKGSILFSPRIPEKIKAARQLGYGAVIKILLLFKEVFWENDSLPHADRHVKNIGFIFSENSIPTWWTQLPDKTPLLTGWLAGPAAEKLKDKNDDIILEYAFRSISSIFNIPKNTVKEKLQASKVLNWTADPFTRGAYSYETVNSQQVKKILMEPVDETLFFAGEAMYEGEHTGTVEAALVSGSRVSYEVLGAADKC